ncbi:FecR family protein [Luteolibacter marinus]|uniref:FecR family protein n=1 Tax=Luteolibacter marinus TaxID=2776705 RepID=UPI001867D2CD|nr:FecR family protein [Luteolibacter marinus]
MDPNWQHWIDRLKSEDLTEAELREFEEALRSDPSRRDDYLSGLLAEVALEAQHLPDPLAATKVIQMPARRWPKTAGIAAGIAALAIASYMAGFHRSAPQTPPVVATVTDSDEAAEKAGLRIGQPLESGRVNIPEGSEIGIAMRGGARLKLRGPANLTIDGPDKVRLEKGRLSTYAPSYAHGFTVDTDDGRVVDLGTRFVTATGTGAGTEIHVIEGLVEVHASASGTSAESLKTRSAAVMKDGRLEPTEYLANRLTVPLDPIAADQDGDGFSDEIESFYGTSPTDGSAFPAPLRFEEGFTGYPPGPLRDAPSRAFGTRPGEIWEGDGIFERDSIRYQNGGRSLAARGGSIQTTGKSAEGAFLQLNPSELAPVGVTYISFLMQTADEEPGITYGGLLLFDNDREQFFIGKVHTADSYGSRMKQAKQVDSYDFPNDNDPHLFVIRIDRTRLVTDIFIDPVPGQPETAATRSFRYQDVPVFDRISVRSGRHKGSWNYQVKIDEARLGLTWESVVPLAE